MNSLIIKSRIGLEKLTRSTACVLDALPDHPTDNLYDISSDTTRLIFDKATKLYKGNHTTVFRGELAAEDDSMDPLDVVIKIDINKAHSESLIREAKYYTTKLDELQGHVIPLYYGLYQAKLDTRDVTCIVLQYCGEPINDYFYDLDKKFKVEVMNRLGYLHQRGVTHGDFREPNVLDNHGVPFIVDFEHAGDHKCRCAREMVVWGSLTPYPSSFNCEELYDLGRDLGVWHGSAFWFYSALVVVRKLKSAQQLFDMVPDRLKSEESARQQIWKEAQEMIKSLAKHSQFHPDVQPSKPLLSPPLSIPPSPLSSDSSANDAGTSE